MDIIVTKSHMAGGTWVHPGETLLAVEDSRAADLFRNGLARPAVVLRARDATTKPAALAKNKAAPAPSTKAVKAPEAPPVRVDAPPPENPAAGDLNAAEGQGPATEQGQDNGTGQS